MSTRMIPTLFVLVVSAAASCWGQESRGSITGKVTDPQGAMIPGASVVITNTETNAVSRTTTNETGYFEVTLLNPGAYSIAAEAPGFKKTVRSGVELSVAGRLDLEFQLEVGAVTETVQVTAAAPLLDTTTASGGRVIDNRQVMQLPFNDLNPFVLTALAPGMQWTGQPEDRRPFDIRGTSRFNTMGNVGQNEYMIDGTPVTGTGRRVGFVPPSDAVEEFKLETTPFDASYGHSSGAVINVMTKAGTNTYHGALYDQHWQQRWNATPHVTRLAFEDAVRQGRRASSDPKQDPGRSNNFGGAFGGPVRVPKLYSGRDKFFFFFSYNGIYQRKAETTSSINRNVPKVAWRTGDFSDLLAVDTVKYTIYDPRSARKDGTRVVRTPFPGNKGIPILNPMYKFYEALYPKPNDVPGVVSPEGLRNYYALGMPKDEDFNSFVNRYDYNLSERHRLYGRWYWNHNYEDQDDWSYQIKKGLNTKGLSRGGKGGGGDYIWTIGPRSTLDIGASWTRFYEGNDRPVQTQYKPSDVGLPAYLDAKAGDLHALPDVVFSSIEEAGSSYPAVTGRGSTGELKVAMTTIRGNHSLKYGWQERRYWFTSSGPGYTSGTFSFNNSFMRATDATTTASGHALDWAAFMMGLPSSISTDTNDSGYWTTRYRAFYLHDDWRLSSRLRLNVGLRYEREGGFTERYNRGISGGFLFDAKLPFTDAAQAAYAKSPLPELAAAQFKVVGGTEYLGTRGKTFNDGTHKLLPRFGAVYQINSKTVVRGGYGWYYDTYNVGNSRASQYGYSQPTSTVITSDTGLTFCCGVGAAENLSASRNPIADPFPVRADGTRFDSPYGNRLGLVALAGRALSFTPRDFSPAFQQRWRIGLQRQISNDMMIDVSYNGARAKIPVTQTISYLPQQYWATGATRNQALDDELNRNVPNPFNIANLTALASSDPLLYNYLSTQSFFRGATLRKHQLLRAFPHMSSLSGLRPGVSFNDARGDNKYHDFQLLVERRFARGLHSALSYTYAYSELRDYYHNEFDSGPSWEDNQDVRPHRWVWSGIYELPLGKGRTWLRSGPLEHVAGGWRLSWIYQYQSGASTSWANRFFYGDINRIGELFKHDQVHAANIHAWFDPSVTYTGAGAIPQGFQGFEGRSAQQPGSFQVRMFPTRLTALRADGIRNWDFKILRQFKITERLNTNFSVDFLNATNHTNFSDPDTNPTSKTFGMVTSQRGVSRVLQFNLRIDF